MSRLALISMTLMTVLLFETVAEARRSPRNETRLTRAQRRDEASLARIIDARASVLAELMESNPEFRDLARRAVAGRNSRRRSGNGLVASGVVIMVLVGAVIGTGLYVGGLADGDPTIETAGIGVMAGGLGLGTLLLVPGIVLLSIDSGAEKNLKTFWRDNQDDLFRPEAMGPRRRQARHAGGSGAFLPTFGFRF
jgi:hypothetical protein